MLASAQVGSMDVTRWLVRFLERLTAPLDHSR